MNLINQTDEPVQETVKERTMNEKITDIDKKFDNLFSNDKKKKEFKIPRKLKSGWKNKLKKSMVPTIVLGENAIMTIEYKLITDGMIMHKDIPRQYNQAFLYYLNGKVPVVVLPEWSMRPIGTKDYIDAATKDKSLVDAETFILKALEKKEFDQGHKFSFNWKIAGIALLIIAAGAWIMYGGAFG